MRRSQSFSLKRGSRISLAAVTEDSRVKHWLDHVDSCVPQLHSHSLHVAIITATFTHYLGYSLRDQMAAIVAALLHDVGKTRLPVSILRKPGPLTKTEWQLMRCHPDIGVILLNAERNFGSDVLTAVQQHHERLNGSGYPQGIQAPSISELVRVLSICDVYGAMTEDRVYEESHSSQEALQVLQARRSQYDPVLVGHFSQMALRESSLKIGSSSRSLDLIQTSELADQWPLGKVTSWPDISTRPGERSLRCLCES